MTRLQALKDFRGDMKKLHSFLNEEGQDKTMSIADPNQDLLWLGYSIEKASNWAKFEIEGEEAND